MTSKNQGSLYKNLDKWRGQLGTLIQAQIGSVLVRYIDILLYLSSKKHSAVAYSSKFLNWAIFGFYFNIFITI